MQEYTFDIMDVRPGPSSQTTDVTRDLLQPMSGQEQIVVDNVTMHADSALALPPEGRTWDEIMGQVFYDYREAWERLAEL